MADINRSADPRRSQKVLAARLQDDAAHLPSEHAVRLLRVQNAAPGVAVMIDRAEIYARIGESARGATLSKKPPDFLGVGNSG